MALGENISAERKRQGFSQDDIAVLIGVSRQAVSKWEKGLSSPSTENMIKLAEILKVSVEKLSDGVDIGLEGKTAGKDRLIYRISDSAYLWLLIKEKLWYRLANPVLFLLYLEMWQTTYQLAYVGMLRKNVLLFVIYMAAAFLIILQLAASVKITAGKKVISFGELLEFTKDGLIITHKRPCAEKTDILWREVKRITSGRRYCFLFFKDGCFLPVLKEDMQESQEKLLYERDVRAKRRGVRIAAAALWIVVTCCAVTAVCSSAVNLNGRLAWKIQELRTQKMVKFEEKNFYALGFEGIIEMAETKVDLMPHLMTNHIDIIFRSDGELLSIDGYISGYDADYKLRAGYLLHYDAAKSGKMMIRTQDFIGIDKSEQKEYDPDNDLSILIKMSKSVHIPDITKVWKEKRYGFYYKGIASWGYMGAEEGIHFIDENGNVSMAPIGPSKEVKGPSLSIYCPDSKEEITPMRYVYKEESL